MNSFTKCLGCSWIRHAIPLCFGELRRQCDKFKSASDDANESTSFVTELESARQSIHRGSNNDLRTSITSQMFMDFQNRRCVIEDEATT
ncbi:hypothetical protein EJ110_NYTH24123 [Nymphaea thermarum]|nr:hypothetical protein EJ110_NYTH24123 [Nymphaea thermarum]